VERPGRRWVPGGRGGAAGGEGGAAGVASGGRATGAEVERPGRRGYEVVRWWRGCVVLMEAAWHEAEAQQG
jgi:hypothetical protein